MKDRKLYKQLIDSGNTPSEAEALSTVATNMGKIKPAGLSDDAKTRIAEEIGVKKVRQLPKLVLAGAGGLVAVLILLSAVLLPVTSEAPATTTSSEKPVETSQPEQAEQIIETKREALNQLITEQAPEQDIEQAEKDYQDALKKSKKSRKQDDKKSKHSDIYEDWRKNRQDLQNNLKGQNLWR